ncbi:hypothetical protein J2808_000863 [Pseudarthrobacter sulfonivorans]|nr:hypothetical protein [Pseudarthrobacter sulfonivorans]
MRHMGISGKFAVITAVAALGMLVLTAITLEEAVMVTFMGLVAVAYVAAVAEVVMRRRHLALLATGVGSSLTIAFSLAFVSTWELAFVDQSTIIGTPLPTNDPDNYFFGAAASAVATVLVLFLGAVWPSGRRLGAGGRPVAGGRKPSSLSRRPAAAPARRPGARGTATGTTGSRGGTAAQRYSGSRAPARLPAAARGPGAPVPAAAASRPSSSAAPVRKPAPKSAPKPAPNSGAKTASRR